MKIDIRHKNTFYSILLFIGLTVISSFIFVKSDFAGLGIIFITELVAVLVGACYLILRLFKTVIPKSDFLYNYFGTINLLLGLFMLTGSLVKGNIVLPILLVLNLGIGGYIYFDIFRRN